MRWAGSWVEGCGAIRFAAGAAAGLCSWAVATPIEPAGNDKPASATVVAANILDLVRRMLMIFLRVGRVGAAGIERQRTPGAPLLVAALSPAFA